MHSQPHFIMHLVLTGLIAQLACYPFNDRQDQITIQVLDTGGHPIQEAEITYHQVSMDFMFSTGWRWQGESTPLQLIERINEIGFNTGHLLMYYMWEGTEPDEGQFNWDEMDHAFDTYCTTLPHETFPNFQHLYISLGPPFGQLDVAPDWVNTSDPGIFREQYGAYLQAFLHRYKDNAHIYAVFGELEGTAHGLSMEETIDWTRWQTSLIRDIDPDAIILIQTGDTHWHFPGQDEIGIGHATAFPKVRLMELLIENEVDFDGFAVETHYGMTAPGDWRQFKEAIEGLTSYDKHIYIWETYYPSKYNPCIYFNWKERAITPKEIPAEWPYPPDTYTEEWQREQIVHSLQSLITNEKVLGINYGTLAGTDFLDGQSDSPGFGFGENLCSVATETHLGLVRSDYTVKPAFTALRDYWQSLFTSGKGKTDNNGEIAFTGMAGEYNILVIANGYKQKSTFIHIIQGEENLFQLHLEPQAKESVPAPPSEKFDAAITVTEQASLTEQPEGIDQPIYGFYIGVFILFLTLILVVFVLWSRNRNHNS